MRIDHIALWTGRLEEMKDFYARHFHCEAGPRYTNPAKHFSSYFLRFAEGARLELMMQGSGPRAKIDGKGIGCAHVALSVGSEEAVRETTDALRAAGVPIISEPRWTGDGYFESVISDPDGNLLEITI